MSRKICIVTGTRAEWGLLSRVAKMLQDDDAFELQIVATNMHLSARYGMTVNEIQTDGFNVDYRVPMEVDGDDDCATVQSMGLALQGFAAAYHALKPDLLLVLGDRYEILAAVSAALIYKIPVAHIGGGEITEGAFDDAIRHAITKMAHLHFTSTQEYREHVIQMGEAPNRVFDVGAVGVDNLMKIPLWSRDETQKSIGDFAINDQTILVTYHPVTMESGTAEEQIDAILEAFDALPELRVVFTMPNSDTGNQIIAQKIQSWCDHHPDRAVWFTSLGLRRYLSLLQYVRAVVGNSSSGIVEAPSFGIFTLNIGDRQKGRTAATSIVNCFPLKEDIIEKLTFILAQPKPIDTINPYFKEDSSAHIVELLKQLEVNPFKQFHKLS